MWTSRAKHARRSADSCDCCLALVDGVVRAAVDVGAMDGKMVRHEVMVGRVKMRRGVVMRSGVRVNVRVAVDVMMG